MSCSATHSAARCPACCSGQNGYPKVTPAAGNLIGGDSPGAPNGPNGILISGVRATGNRVQGNTISINYDAGVVISDSASGNLIGGTEPGARNVIAGNGHRSSASQTPVGAQVVLGGNNNLVQGNYIGLDATGTLPQAGEARSGVEVSGAFNVIGGTAPGAGNVISGHDAFSFQIRTRPAGIRVSGGNATSDIVIQGNRIGTSADGRAAVPNERGIVVEDDLVNEAPQRIRIGGASAAASNIIAFNLMEGIVVNASPPVVPSRVLLARNAIYGNGLLGIDLLADGVTLNDAGDADSGPNTLLNFPVITSAVDNGTATIVRGQITTPNAGRVTVEVFISAARDASGYGEGQVFVGRTPANAEGAFTLNLPPGLTGRFITATARDAGGNTSEFSLARRVVAQ